MQGKIACTGIIHLYFWLFAKSRSHMHHTSLFSKSSDSGSHRHHASLAVCQEWWQWVTQASHFSVFQEQWQWVTQASHFSSCLPRMVTVGHTGITLLWLFAKSGDSGSHRHHTSLAVCQEWWQWVTQASHFSGCLPRAVTVGHTGITLLWLFAKSGDSGSHRHHTSLAVCQEWWQWVTQASHFSGCLPRAVTVGHTGITLLWLFAKSGDSGSHRHQTSLAVCQEWWQWVTQASHFSGCLPRAVTVGHTGITLLWLFAKSSDSGSHRHHTSLFAKSSDSGSHRHHTSLAVCQERWQWVTQASHFFGCLPRAVTVGHTGITLLRLPRAVTAGHTGITLLWLFAKSSDSGSHMHHTSLFAKSGDSGPHRHHTSLVVCQERWQWVTQASDFSVCQERWQWVTQASHFSGCLPRAVTVGHTDITLLCLPSEVTAGHTGITPLWLFTKSGDSGSHRHHTSLAVCQERW